MTFRGVFSERRTDDFWSLWALFCIRREWAVGFYTKYGLTQNFWNGFLFGVSALIY